MSGFDLALLVAGFVLFLVVLGLWADDYDRRDARNRNHVR